MVAVLPDDLSSALDDELARHPVGRLTQSVDRLSARYRQGDAATSPILSSEADVAAYAGYRMPATYAAVHAVLAEAALRAPGFQPRTQVDVGGGTGAAVWAAAAVWPSLTRCTVVEQVAGAIGLGKRLASGAGRAAVRDAEWRRGFVDPAAPAPEADLVTLSYVLGELPEAGRADVVRWLAAESGTVALIEPGTPAGYERIRAARAQLIGLGRHVVAPCPHDAACPIVPGEDWCHFAARLPRSGLHRKLKAGTLGFEDEKFAYVVASRSATVAERPDARIIRHPKKHKGWVALDLCTPDGLKPSVAVSKKQGPRYRAARDAEWGDGWSST
ncbi:rRNA methylase [Amycolatopsis mediterranei S699]|uniref:Predicted rRNA methylase n=4 Tax=Amycolatopsis mediterranei TaxID=33910 RepID=A0A0H3DJG8_AMYMU|nr:small ribosomal subunit Rsm22 family protein [Amycolatopsis mediterranei]ADJ50342.1 predicted rRNA methylase [Amycolatopsis mediterranei U32]AEK47343.1 rRNA methylase [Amycolatopsis mediterranei S699]AFO82049.1 rRNA methylase [Amycolatopsis mediterranei S699]AGT89178.1 rRNA methylase [Amycolatopsis mediterranei RB]UZF75325.1 small ribosomal subunit Rsm22 family protein [Amycolatopsis mediterranei]